MAKITGIGGVFFKSTTDHKKLAEWYRDNLGLELQPWGGAILNWNDDARKDEGGQTTWMLADSASKWFGPSEAPFMINYRVDDLTGLIAQLKASGIELVAGPDEDDNGKFAWVMDPDGNKVELWEPKGSEAAG